MKEKMTWLRYIDEIDSKIHKIILMLYNKDLRATMKDEIRLFWWRLETYQQELKLIKSNSECPDYFEIFWLFNFTKEIIIKIDAFFKLYNIHVLKKFYEKNDFDYENLYKIKDGNIDTVILKINAKSDNEMGGNQKVYALISSIRDFMVHVSPNGFGHIFQPKYKNKKCHVSFVNRNDPNKYFDLEVNYFLPIKFLNNFLKSILDCENELIEKIYGTNKKKLLIPKDWFIKDEIIEYLKGNHYNLNLNPVLELGAAKYNAFYYYDSVKNSMDSEHLYISILITKISCWHFIKNYYDYDFYKYINIFDIENFENLFGENNKRLTYAVEQLEHYPEIFKKEIGDKLYKKIMKRDSSLGLYRNVYSLILEEHLKKNKKFIQNIEKYFYYIVDKENKTMSFNVFLEQNI